MRVPTTALGERHRSHANPHPTPFLSFRSRYFAVVTGQPPTHGTLDPICPASGTRPHCVCNGCESRLDSGARGGEL